MGSYKQVCGLASNMRRRFRGSHRPGDDGMPMTHPASGSSSGRSTVIGGVSELAGLCAEHDRSRQWTGGPSPLRHRRRWPVVNGCDVAQGRPGCLGRAGSPFRDPRFRPSRSASRRPPDPLTSDVGGPGFRVPDPGGAMRSATAEARRSTWCKKSHADAAPRAGRDSVNEPRGREPGRC